MIKRVPEIDGLRVDEAHKGGSRGPSAAEVAAQKAQAKELADLEAKEEARTKAMGRKRRGRASLLTGSETGDKDVKKKQQTLGTSV